MVDENQIELTIHFDTETGFGKKLFYWLEKNGFEKFSKHLKVEKINSNNVYKIDFSESEIISSNMKYDRIELFLFRIRIEEEAFSDNESYADFYLNEIGNTFVNFFYSDFYVIDDTPHFKCLYSNFFNIW